MRVIEKGNGQKGWAKELKCTGKGNGENSCGATLLVEESDIYYTGSKQCYGDNYPDYFYGFICPECGCVTDTNAAPSRVTKKITKTISQKIRKKLNLN